MLVMLFSVVGTSFFVLSGCGESKDTAGQAPPPSEAQVQAEQEATRKAMQSQGKK